MRRRRISGVESPDSRHKGAGCVSLITTNAELRTEKGIALVTALIITFVVFLLVMSTIYMVTTSTTISGAGKRYATACEAADGAVEAMKDAIGLVIGGEPIDNLPFTETSGLKSTIFTETAASTAVKLTLPSTEFLKRYDATITLEYIGAKTMHGQRLEFPPAAGGAGGKSKAQYFRIAVIVLGPNNAQCETVGMYRYVAQ